VQAHLHSDVGSYDTAPHHLAIDKKGMVHLIVADVNIFQDNRLDLYWAIGDPATGKWTAAWLLDRRGFTVPLTLGGVRRLINFCSRIY